MRTVGPPPPLEKLFVYLDWTWEIRTHPTFPLIDFGIDYIASTGEISVRWYDRRTGEYGALSDPARNFPSPALIAGFQLLAGPLDEARNWRNKIYNRRTRRHL